MQIINNSKEIGQGVTDIINSPAFRYGEGFFTTTRVKNYVPLWLDDHIKRLMDSLADFNMEIPDAKEMKSAADRWPRKNNLKDGFMRIMCWVQESEVKVFLTGGKINNTPDKLHGLKTAFYHRHRSNPLLGYKTFNYWPNNLAYNDAVKQGYYEAVFLNEKGEICETSRCNIFWTRGETLYTPETGCGLLKGIARDKVLYLADKLEIKVLQGKFQIKELEQADEVFLTNSVRGIIGISNFEKRYSYNQEGPIIQKLTRAYNMLTEEYLQKF